MMDKVYSVKIEGPYEFRHINIGTLVDYFDSMCQRDWEHLPSLAVLEKGIMGNPRDLKSLMSRIIITIKFEDGYVLIYTFNPGLITDLASVPSWLRGIMDNDDPRVIPAALVHDRNFVTQGLGDLGFRWTNKLFYQMLRKSGYPLSKSVLAYLAVMSPVGRRLFKTTNKNQYNHVTHFSSLMVLSAGKLK